MKLFKHHYHDISQHQLLNNFTVTPFLNLMMKYREMTWPSYMYIWHEHSHVSTRLIKCRGVTHLSVHSSSKYLRPQIPPVPCFVFHTILSFTRLYSTIYCFIHFESFLHLYMPTLLHAFIQIHLAIKKQLHVEINLSCRKPAESCDDLKSNIETYVNTMKTISFQRDKTKCIIVQM